MSQRRATPLPQVQAASWGRSQRLTLFLSTEKVAAQPVQLPGRKRAEVRQSSGGQEHPQLVYRFTSNVTLLSFSSLPFPGGLGRSSLRWGGHWSYQHSPNRYHTTLYPPSSVVTPGSSTDPALLSSPRQHPLPALPKLLLGQRLRRRSVSRDTLLRITSFLLIKPLSGRLRSKSAEH